MVTTEKIQAKQKLKLWPQWLAASTIHILALLIGLAGGWTSPFLAKLLNGTESLVITTDEASWIASLLNAMRPVGVIIGAVIMHKSGAQKAVLSAGIPHALAWTCFLIGESVPWIYTSRVLSGLGLGMYFCTFPIYIGEISDPRIRGALVALIAQGQGIGNLLGNLLGPYLDMKLFAIISLVLTAVFLASFLFFPDSPYHLVKTNRIEEARKSLKWYNRQEDVTAELESLKLYMAKQQKLSLKALFEQLSTPLNRKIMIMVNCIWIFTQMSGYYSILLYLEIIVTSLRVDVIAPSSVVIFVGGIGIVSGLTSMYTNDRFGRRTMLATSSLGVSIIFALLAVNFLLLKEGYDSSNLQWLSISGIMLYQFFLSIGIANIPSCILSEIFPPQLKEIGTCIVNIVSALSAFIMSKSYQPMLDATSEEFVFFFYAVLMFLMFLYTIIVIPETKGKSLQDIQEMLTNKRKKVSEIQNSESAADSP